MNCPTCKNPIMNPAPNCEWCGAVIIPSKIKIDNDIMILIKQKKLLKAVSLYKERYSCSLLEAKRFVDKM